MNERDPEDLKWCFLCEQKNTYPGLHTECLRKANPQLWKPSSLACASREKSATIAELDEAAEICGGYEATGCRRPGKVISAEMDHQVWRPDLFGAHVRYLIWHVERECRVQFLKPKWSGTTPRYEFVSTDGVPMMAKHRGGPHRNGHAKLQLTLAVYRGRKSYVADD